VAPEYDLELARSLLADAGYPEGRGLPELELVLSKPQRAHAGTVISAAAADLGARLRIRTVDTALLPSDLEGCHLWLSGWTADYPDPDGIFRGLLRGAWPFYRDEEIDEILVTARSLGDQAERLRLYHQVDRLWVSEHAAILPLSYSRAMIARRPWVEGLGATPLSHARLDAVVIGDRDRSAVPVPDEPQAVESQ
jgi:ABC-type transport system substrate-binding protein